MKKTLLLFLFIITTLLPNAQTLNQSFYVDFGPTGGTKGAVTSSPDENNNYWNNATSGTLSSVTDLINSTGATTTLALEITDNFVVNTSVNYGPTTTSSTDIGNLSISTATQDYFYLETGGSGNSAGQLTFKNLDANKGYIFTIFGSRPTGSVRITNYIIAGVNSFTEQLQTSDGSTGNLTNLVTSDMIIPTEDGNITLDVSIISGSFGYINAIKIEEYTDLPMVDVTQINLSGNAITTTGAQSQITAEVLPSNATIKDVSWSVDDESIALISSTGLITPLKNGTITVTATSTQNPTISNTIDIAISNQITELFLSGTATENGDDVSNAIPMHMLTGDNGAVSSQFEVYTSLNTDGSFMFYQAADASSTSYGEGSATNTIEQGGSAIASAVSGTVRITVDLAANTYEILPITWSVVGSTITNGWSGDEPLSYHGNGIWSAQLDMDVVTSDTSPRFIFKGNQSWSYVIKRIIGTENSICMESLSSSLNYTLEDIGLAYGKFVITLNLSNYTYSIECVDIDSYKVSFMGSSVCNGQGATNMQGYAYQYDQLLQERISGGSSPFYRSNISVNGNNTVAVMNRFEKDLLGGCGKYVVFGLALGNEGIHENGESAFNQFNENMQTIISKTKEIGKIPVIMNNYTRADYTATDYDFVKQMNLIIAQWDIPSTNLLGAVDNGAGQWATGYMADLWHPNDAGHTEMFYTMVPSLFDALEAEKPQPVFTTDCYITPNGASAGNTLSFTPDNTIHPFTVSFDIKTSGTGNLMVFSTSSTEGTISVTTNGYLQYTAPSGETVTSTEVINDNNWHKVTLTHYYAWGSTILYLDANSVGSISEKLEASTFNLHGTNAPSNISYRNWLFYRSGMNEMEIGALNDGNLLKSSLELYAPLDGNGILSNNVFVNLAQSTNEINSTDFALSASDNMIETNNISLFPNPTKDVVKILHNNNTQVSEVNIYNSVGSRTLQYLNSSTFSLATLPNGIYIVNVISNMGTSSHKVVKE